MTKVEYSDPDDVQAYGDAEFRAIVGSRLIIGPERAAWVLKSGSERKLRDYEGFFAPCTRPTVKSLGDDNYQLLCRGKDVLAPGMTLMGDGTLVIIWWDGIDIYLRKSS